METQELPGPDEIVAKWLRRSKRIQDLHYDAAATLMRWHRWTGGFLVVLSVVEGSTLLGMLSKTTTLSPDETVITGVIGLFVAVLAAMQAFMSFESRSRLHYIAGAKYGAIKRKIEATIATDSTGKDAAEDLKQLGPEWDALTEESEPIPFSIWKKGKQKEKEKEERKKKKEAKAESAVQAK